MARLLIADDHVDTTRLYHFLLAQRGHQVHCASDVDQAIALGRATAPDLAICDWEFVDREGGLELAKTLCEEAPLLRLMFVSGHPPAALWPRLDGLRVTSILWKPVEPADLVREVERALASEANGCGAKAEAG
jgi:CheY-like chemotaxis protein